MIGRVIIYVLAICAGSYLLICAYFYFKQDGLIFHPTKLPKNYAFDFNSSYTEYNIPYGSDTLNGVLFKTHLPRKGLVFFLHGNAGDISKWEPTALLHTQCGFDFFIMDYPGYGKSTGHISKDDDLLNSAECAYKTIAPGYANQKLIIEGYSIGTGAASWLAARHQPQLLILLAPFYDFKQIIKQKYPFLPAFISKYNFPNYHHISQSGSKLMLFHGEDDEVIPCASSQALHGLIPGSQLFLLPGQTHNDLVKNDIYQQQIQIALNNL